ncbi:MAG: ankyrin repeat domain-containing protein, partial [Longimicrobiales bacterium]
AWAVACGKPEAVRALLEQGAPQIAAPDGRSLGEIAGEKQNVEIVELLEGHRRIEATHQGRVRWFVKNACPDHDIRGPAAHAIARNTAQRMLRAHPEIARDSFYTAIVCGSIAEVERLLAGRPGLANEKGGAKGWEPLLYLCFTRLPSVHDASNNAIAMARLLLDRGADPNAYFMAGDSRYTPLVGVIGEGEEDRPPHPQRDALVRLLLDRGAEPYDSQVLYNIHFHGNVLWFLKLIYDESVRRDRSTDWRDPEWHMLDMGGYGTGARYLLEIAVRKNDVALAVWLLAHGANPESPAPSDPRFPKRSLYEAARRVGHDAVADALARYGATKIDVQLQGEDAFVRASVARDFEGARRLAAEHPEYLRSPGSIISAAERDRPDVVAFLLDMGVPIEIENERKQRPLHAAAWKNALYVAELLIARGADIDPRESQWGNTPLDFAVYGQLPDMITLLSRYSRDIWNLVFTGNVERVRKVLNENPELARVVSRKNETPLMWLPDDEAAAVRLVELLLAHGADPAIRDNNGRTAADHASRRGLDEAGALLQARDSSSLFSLRSTTISWHGNDRDGTPTQR